MRAFFTTKFLKYVPRRGSIGSRRLSRILMHLVRRRGRGGCQLKDGHMDDDHGWGAQCVIDANRTHA